MGCYILLGLQSDDNGHGRSNPTGPWTLTGSIASELVAGSEWSREMFDRNLSGLRLDRADIERCARADSTRLRVLSDVFRAAALGIRGTPTVIVDGVQIGGKFESGPLEGLIRDRLRAQERLQPVQ